MDLNIYMYCLVQILHQFQYFMYANSEVSGETTGSLFQTTTISKSQSKIVSEYD